jgi:pRiA4b ORF-3-like protein
MIRLLKDHPLYQLRVALKGSQPAIWRRFQVRKETTLLKLHKVLQVVMGWENYHLHEFRIGDLSFGEPFPDSDFIDERPIKLTQIAPSGPLTFEYIYDFGDGWRHEVTVEKGVDKKAGVYYPICIEGARACPPEDVGGIGGYEPFLKAIANRRHPEHKRYLEWIGGYFDSEAFDLETVNRKLSMLR